MTGAQAKGAIVPGRAKCRRAYFVYCRLTIVDWRFRKERKMKALITILIVLAVTGGGCCSMMTGTKQEISVTSDPSGAQVRTAQGHRTITPGILTLSKKGHYVVTVEYAGYHSQSKGLIRKWNNWLWADILWDWGIITWPLEFWSGAAYEFRPKSLHFDMRKLETADTFGPIDLTTFKK